MIIMPQQKVWGMAVLAVNCLGRLPAAMRFEVTAPIE